MKWLKNLELLSRENKTGLCPFCNSDNTEVSFAIVDEETKMGHGTIWCNDCRKAYHISRVQVSDEMKIGDVPKGLIY